MFSLIPPCDASSSSHASIFLAAQEATYALLGSELCVCCPVASVHMMFMQQSDASCSRAELPFPLLLQGTPQSSALPVHWHFMILVGVKYL